MDLYNEDRRASLRSFIFRNLQSSLHLSITIWGGGCMNYKEVRNCLDEILEAFREDSKYKEAVDIAKSCIDYTEVGYKLTESNTKGDCKHAST